MHKNIFPLFITSLGLFTAYVFYALWHTESVNPSAITDISQETQAPLKKPLPKKLLSPTDNLITKTHLDIKNTSKKSHKKEVVFVETLPQNVQDVEEQTQEVYEALVPDNYDEINEQSHTAFSRLDAAVIEMNEQILREEEMLDLER